MLEDPSTETFEAFAQLAPDKPRGDVAKALPPVATISAIDTPPTVVSTGLPPKPSEIELAAERNWKVMFERKLEEIAGTALQTKESKAALAKLVNVSKRLSDAESPILYRQAYLAALAFGADHEKSEVASAIVDDMEFVSSRNGPIYIVMRGLMLFLFLFVVVPALVSVALVLIGSDMFWYVIQYQQAAAVAGLFGVLGSIVSILLRLSDFAETKRKSRDFLFSTGFALPFVGLVFAWVTSALFSSHMINVGMSGTLTETADYGFSFYIVIGFLSGFSERFTKGLLGATENTLTPTRPAREGTMRDLSRPDFATV